MNLILQIFVSIILWSLAVSCLSIAPFAPTRKKDLERINKLMSLSKWQKILEIGFWDGRVSRYLAKNNKECEFIWVELSPLIFLIWKIISFYSPQKNLKLKLKNAFKEDFSKYDYIYIFAMPEVLKKKLKEKFLKEMKPRAKIISYCFDINDWPWEIIKDKPNSDRLSIYTMIR